MANVIESDPNEFARTGSGPADMLAAPGSNMPVFLDGGGEMGGLMRSHDWAASLVGPLEAWPQTLRTVVRLLLNTRHPMFIFWGPALTCFYNDAYRASIGPERHPSALGSPGRDVWSEIWCTIGPQIDQVMAGGDATWHENHLVPITRHGRLEDVYWTYSFCPIDHEESATGVGGVLVICTETTAAVTAGKRLAEQAEVRRAERDRLAQLFAQAPSFIAMLSGPEHRFDMANAAYARLVNGRTVLGLTVAEALPEAVEQGYLELLDKVFRTGEAFTSKGMGYVVPATSGGPSRQAFVDFIYQPVRSDAGEPIGIFVEGTDVTDRVLAESALRHLNASLEQRICAEIAARSQTEDVLRQAQKMEALGQLTGGIAHDLNNMLQVVGGAIQLAKRSLARERPADAVGFLDAAQASVDRSAATTQRLLAFGRKHELNPVPVVIATLVTGMASLFQQTVGPWITTELDLMDGCWPVWCDPNQLENALLNLAINARDAMLPLGGRLVIRTSHAVLDVADFKGWEPAAPGDYVCITVSDAGTGMTPAVLVHALEPFFTTKRDGKGSGLGLSQIHGFMRQSGGILQIQSVVGVGTSVHLHLPRYLGGPRPLSG